MAPFVIARSPCGNPEADESSQHLIAAMLKRAKARSISELLPARFPREADGAS